MNVHKYVAWVSKNIEVDKSDYFVYNKLNVC